MTHTLHAPSWHTRPEPQGVPFGWLSDSRHTEAPVAQSTVPRRHAFWVTAHAVPSAHALHAPSRHTEPTSHDVPLDWIVCVS